MTRRSMGYVTFDGTMFSQENKRPLPSYEDGGGPWLAQYKREHRVFSKARIAFGPFGAGLYDGPWGVSGLQPAATQTELSLGSEVSDDTLTTMGTTMIAKCEPTNPASDFSTFIGELRSDGLPSPTGHTLWREQTLNARKGGSEYLNVEFGWKPLVADLKSFYSAVKDSHDLVKQYHKNSGDRIRRSLFNPETNRSLSLSGNMMPTPLDFGRLVPGSIFETATEKVWFKGAFRYFVPMGDDFVSKLSGWASDARYLFGVEITPEVVWNLAPWSWAADWFSNTGDVLHNISALGHDGLVMEYGYAMAEQNLWQTGVGRDPQYGTASYERIYKRMKRIRASPYGFGVNFSSLSDRQVAIVAALGLSRT